MHIVDPLIEQIIAAKRELRDMMLRHYFEYELFHWTWWVGVVGIIVSLVLWLAVVDKKRILEVCFYGLIIMISVVFLDVFGSEYVFWEYRVHTLPVVPLLFPVDMAWLPIAYMLIYQKFPKWKTYLLVVIAASAFFAFAMEPLVVFVDQYRLLTWKYWYSFPIYIIIGIIAKFASEKLKKLQMRQLKR